MELQITQDEKRGEAEAKVFEAAGGYAPTVGIIGAVLGLIQVMKNLENIEEVGHGIAVAFVATVYGVGVANLLFLPAAAKIKARVHARHRSPRADARRRLQHRGRPEPETDSQQAGSFSEPGGAPKKAAKGAKAAVGEAASSA